jgi:hypothetical protein
MWISLSPSVAEIDFNNDINATAAIEELFSSAHRGDHIVFSDRDTLKRLLLVKLSVVSHSGISALLSQFAFIASLESLQKFRVIIDPTASKIANQTSNIWRMPLHHFSKVALVPSCILAENLRDARAYINSAHHANSLSKIKGVRITLTKDSGGGADISNKFTDLINDKRQFIIAITDTDKTHPNDSSCAATKKCVDLSANSKWVTHHIELPCSEIENFLPINLLSDSVTETPSKSQLAEQLAFLNKSTFKDPDLHKWFDAKNGTKLSRIKENNLNEPERSHWKKSIILNNNFFQCKQECFNSIDCPINAIKDCECILIPGLGSETLDRFNDHCKNISIQKQCERVKTSNNAADWLDLGALLASWGIALEKQRS